MFFFEIIGKVFEISAGQNDLLMSKEIARMSQRLYDFILTHARWDVLVGKNLFSVRLTHEQKIHSPSYDAGINIQNCDITDDDALYKLVFEYYCSDIKYQSVQSSKFC